MNPILTKICLMDKIPRVFFLLGSLTRIHISHSEFAQPFW